jgi:hypothetical protein
MDPTSQTTMDVAQSTGTADTTDTAGSSAHASIHATAAAIETTATYGVTAVAQQEIQEQLGKSRISPCAPPINIL